MAPLRRHDLRDGDQAVPATRRLPNLFTAAARFLAGWLLVRGTYAEPEHWLPLVLASMSIYAAGIALNDLFDYEIDLHGAPARPPSGNVSKQFASWQGWLLAAAGPLLAALSGSWMSVIVSLVLVGCVLSYDLGLKKTPLGPVAMGACRGLNLLLGMSQHPTLGGPAGWLVAGSLAVFVAGITWISRSETQSGPNVGLYGGTALENLAIVGLVGAALWPGGFPSPNLDRPIVAPEGLLVIVLVAWIVNIASGRAVGEPVPARVQQAVKTGVLSLVWLDVGMVAAVRGPLTALAVAALWFPAFILGRWLYSP